MKKGATAKKKANALRRQAGARLREFQGRPGHPKDNSEVHRLVHELQVHQIELELQNEELRQSELVARQAVEKFTDLYDFAPVGYFSLDPEGRIMEVNLTGTVMFGVERSGLLKRRFPLFVEEGCRSAFNSFIERSFKTRRKHACETRLVKANRTAFWADLEAVASPAAAGTPRLCRVAVVDISARKHADEVQARLDVLAASNRKLEQEILQRRKAESALRRSEQKSLMLLEESQRLQEQLRNLTRRILRAQEEERKLISRELHDEISQTLVGIGVHLSLLRESEASLPRVLKKRIFRTQRLVEQSVAIVHQFARRLRPPQLDDLGLTPALRSFLADFSERTGMRVRLKMFRGVEQLGSNRRTVLFRVAQEAAINVEKHAEADAVGIVISRIPDAVSMVITDNGSGFDVAEKTNQRRNRRLGLVGMKERVEMVGGSFGIESVAGKGTTIRVQIPFRETGAGGHNGRQPGSVKKSPATSAGDDDELVLDTGRTARKRSKD